MVKKMTSPHAVTAHALSGKAGGIWSQAPQRRPSLTGAKRSPNSRTRIESQREGPSGCSERSNAGSQGGRTGEMVCDEGQRRHQGNRILFERGAKCPLARAIGPCGLLSLRDDAAAHAFDRA